MSNKFTRLSTAIIASLAISFFVCNQRPPLTWDYINIRIANSFPHIPHISQQQLLDILKQKPIPVLLDVRTSDEYKTSHISGAVWIGDNQSWQPPGGDSPIIVYCSVGWRSAQWCERLQSDGFTEVYNLQGGIFSWANAGLPLEKNGQNVHEVHPYDARWGVLLNQALHPSAADE